jgi:hypothetical protein
MKRALFLVLLALLAIGLYLGGEWVEGLRQKTEAPCQERMAELGLCE